MNVASLWDFSNPEASESRFREALRGAEGDEALILHTQIARTYGLRCRFEEARANLAAIEPQIASAGAEARVRWFLELGRTWLSAAHAPEHQTDTARLQAEKAYLQALEIAREAGLDGLAIDTMHMLAMVETDIERQLKWNRDALDAAAASPHEDARAWEASLRNNIGCSLHDAGRYDEALEAFRLAVAVRERGSSINSIRIAHYMVARTLRAMGRLDEALEIQLRLERERDADGTPGKFVFQELETLYRAKGDEERAAHYAARRLQC